MYLGRFAQGTEVLLPLETQDLAHKATSPQLPPLVRVYGPTGVRLVTSGVPPLDRYGAGLTLFAYRLFLGPNFPTGRYMVSYSYLVAGQGYLRTANFDVVGGGDPNGAVVSMYALERPQAQYLVQRTDGGLRVFGRNPSL